jgi:hypothetical protein
MLLTYPFCFGLRFRVTVTLTHSKPATSDAAHMSIAKGTKLGSGEVYWRDHQPWLEDCGYMLRARYRPGWEEAHRETKKRIPVYHPEGPPLIVCTLFLTSIGGL